MGLRIFGLLLLAACLPERPAVGAAQGDWCTVAEVVDGDTLRCADGRRVRLIGIDAPEHGQGGHGIAARRALEHLAPPGTPVRLEADVAPTDRYRRTLAYLWAGATLVNEALVRGGWAVLYTVPPNVKYAARLRRAQNEARAAGAGLWARGGFDCLPSDFRRGRCER